MKLLTCMSVLVICRVISYTIALLIFSTEVSLDDAVAAAVPSTFCTPSRPMNASRSPSDGVTSRRRASAAVSRMRVHAASGGGAYAFR